MLFRSGFDVEVKLEVRLVEFRRELPNDFTDDVVRRQRFKRVDLGDVGDARVGEEVVDEPKRDNSKLAARVAEAEVES